MTLRAWLKLKRMTIDEFCKENDFSRGGVLKWMSGERFPRKAALTKINLVTKGKVRANDFVG